MPRRMKVNRMELAVGAIVAVGVVLIALGAYGMHLSNIVWNGSLSARHRTPPFDIVASSGGNGRVTLRAIRGKTNVMDLHHEGTFGIVSADGYGQVGRIIERGDDYSVREYTPLTATISAAEQARLDLYAYPEDPLTAHGIVYETVRYRSELGDCPAWFIPGSSRTWLVFAHGRGAHPNEGLRIMPTLVDAGLPVLAITYRNDDDAPASADRQHWLGLTEWNDLENAVRYALDNGAEDVVLYGYSMGGGMCLNLLCESPLSEKVRGVIMDSPLLDFGETLDIVGDMRGYPRFIVVFGKWIAGLRFGINWKRMNYIGRTHGLRAPMLVLHGEADALVPAPTSRRLAITLPKSVRYIGFANAAHARSWNLNPKRYEASVRDFLREVLRDEG